MLKIKAERLIQIGTNLQACFENKATHQRPNAKVSESDRKLFVELLSGLLQDCKFMKLVRAEALIASEIGHYSDALGQTYRQMSSAAFRLNGQLFQELSEQVVVVIDPDRSKFMRLRDEFAAEPPFGKNVADKFRSAETDIIEACWCFATHRETACVFHSMRIAEKGLGALASALTVPFAFENWQNLIERIEKAIRDTDQTMPKGQLKADLLNVYTQAASQFFYWKTAWRNHVMHGKAIYDAEQAQTIFFHVRDFMRYLAAGGLHE